MLGFDSLQVGSHTILDMLSFFIGAWEHSVRLFLTEDRMDSEEQKKSNALFCSKHSECQHNNRFTALFFTVPARQVQFPEQPQVVINVFQHRIDDQCLATLSVTDQVGIGE